MTEEKASRETNRGPGRESGNSDSGRNRKGRRRYFQTKKDGRSQPSGNQPGGQSGQSGQSNQGNQSGQSQRGQESNRRSEGKRGEEAPRQRKARRRARSRQRYDEGRRSDAANLEAEVAYIAPQSVYIYEHSAHPELRDSYEFRPDHFSKVGRTLADYQIDLSKLFPGDIADDGTPVLTNMLPKPQFDWSEWEDTRSPDANQAAAEAASPETRPDDEQKG